MTGLKIVRGRGKTKAAAFEFRDAVGRLEISFDADGLGLIGAKVCGRDCLVADGHGRGACSRLSNRLNPTGVFRWGMGAHWRYTRAKAWLRKVTPQVLKSCDFIL